MKAKGGGDKNKIIEEHAALHDGEREYDDVATW